MKTKILGALILIFVIGFLGSSIFFYQGCGNGMSGNNMSGESLCRPAIGSEPVDKNYDILPGQQTASIAYGRPLLDSMAACTGIGQVSTRTLTEWTTRNQSLSEYGNLTEVSSAMMMAIAAVAGEVCRDLIDREVPLSNPNRFIFGAVDFAKTGPMTSTEIDSSVDMLGLSCWQRLPTLEEKSTLRTAIEELGANTEVGALTLCTSMLASLSAIAQ